MKSKIAVILLAVFLCLTTGCNNASHIAETPDPISSSDSNIVPSESETAQAEKKTEVDRPQSTESQTENRVAEFPASVSESDTQTTEVPDQADHSTAVLPQPSEPEKKTDESERRPETAAPTEKEQPTPPATEESTPPEPPKEEPTEPVFDIDYWISFAKSYAESIGLALDSGAVYCWDNPIAAGVKCKYTERDIRGYLDRYAKLRPGGVMALITSKGTMDKENSAVRKYIAQRADLLGAIRLPNNTFKGNAGTEVVSDILILQKESHSEQEGNGNRTGKAGADQAGFSGLGLV